MLRILSEDELPNPFNMPKPSPMPNLRTLVSMRSANCLDDLDHIPFIILSFLVYPIRLKVLLDINEQICVLLVGKIECSTGGHFHPMLHEVSKAHSAGGGFFRNSKLRKTIVLF